MKLEIRHIGNEGDGIAYYRSKPIFVKNALVGEIVDASLDSENTAHVNRYIRRSDKRNDKVCRSYRLCGGCSLLHALYDEQLSIKKNILRQSLERCDVHADGLEIVPSESRNYRNSLKLPFCMANGKLVNALYAENTNHFVIFDECYNHERILEDIRKEILDICNEFHLVAYDRHTKKGLRYLYLRHLGNAVQTCIVTGDDALSKELVYRIAKIEGIVSLYQSINTSRSSLSIFGKKMIHLSGSSSLRFTVNGLKANLSIRSFYQMNTAQAARLYNHVSSLIKDNQETIVEAYCGVGIMAMQVARKARQVIGIEIIPDAIANAISNAKANSLDNVRFICGDSAVELRKIAKKEAIDVLIVDPPRGGLDGNMLEAIRKSKIRTIIYVSCNHLTLAENIDELSRFYRVSDVKAFDIFPNTAHVETVCLLERRK